MRLNRGLSLSLSQSNMVDVLDRKKNKIQDEEDEEEEEDDEDDDDDSRV